MFLENEITNKKTPILATVLFILYKEEFLVVGGTQDDIDNYTVQNLILKVKEQFEDICINKLFNFREDSKGRDKDISSKDTGTG